MKICYLGHPAHAQTKSSEFFEDILRSIGSVSIFRPTQIDVDDVLRLAIETDYDLYVFFQFDFLAYAFLAAGKKVLVVPMVDGSASYGSEHWKLLKGAGFVSFSESLHLFLRLTGHKSFHIQFWPEPIQNTIDAKPYVYYWPRGNHRYISVKTILSTFENYPEMQIRVRSVESPDSKLDYSRMSSERLNIVEVNDRSDHLKEVMNSSIFVSPRPSEGIGHSFLEALSVGRSVIGRNYPTMSEYIIHGYNGAFFKKNARPLETGINWKQLGKNAYFSTEQGRASYLESLKNLKVFITNVTGCNRKFKVSEVHRLLDLSSSIMRGQYFPVGNTRTLQNWIRMRNPFNFYN
jgi:glycosyltransferase involved in cell wall biosynthesis